MGDGGFWIRLRGRVTGPHTFDALTRMVRRGQLGRADEVSSDGVSWAAAGTFADLFPGGSCAGSQERLAPPTENRDKWFYVREGKTYGPMPFKLLTKLAENQTLLPSDQVWCEGGKRVNANQASELTPYFMPEPVVSTRSSGTAPAEEPATDDRTSHRLVVILSTVVILISGMTILLWILLANDHSDFSFSPPEISQKRPKVPVSTSSHPSLLTPSSGLGTRPLPEAVPIPPELAVVRPVALAPASSTSVTSLSDDVAVGDAVGFVVIGMHIESESGIVLEIPVASGSCFAISPKGFLLTNNHVVRDYIDARNDPSLRQLARQYMLRTLDPMVWVFFKGNKHTAELVHDSKTYDMAILKVNRPRGSFLALSARPEIQRGTEAIALGFPGVARTPLSVAERIQDIQQSAAHVADVKEKFKLRDFEFTLTKGIVSRLVTETEGGKWIQHEAVIRPGNSGGPLVGTNALVIGINTRVQAETGVAQTNMASEISQMRAEIDRYVSDVQWK